MKLTKTPNKDQESKTWPQIIAVLICCIAGVSRGLIYAWTSPSIPALLADPSIDITLEQASYLTVIYSTSMVVTVPFVLVIEGIGRKAMILLLSVPQLLSWISVLMAKGFWLIYVSRMLAGIADAIFYGVVSIYICEITEPKIRGIWGPAASISSCVGSVLINIIGSYNDIQTTAYICSCFPILHFVLAWFMPESPYFLLMKGDEIKARNELQILRWTTNVENELISLKSDVKRQLSEAGSFKELVTINSNRKALLICIMVRWAQQLSGISTLESYTQYMFQKTGSAISEKTSSILVSGLALLSIILSAYTVESKGRRPLLIFSCLSSGVVLGALAIYLCLKHYTDLDLSQFYWIPLVDLLLYVVVCSPGIAIVPSLLIGELFSTSIKAKAVCVMNTILGVGYLIVPKVFQSLTDSVGIHLPFLIFTFSCFLGAVLSYMFLIETKGKTLEQIQMELKRSNSERNVQNTKV